MTYNVQAPGPLPNSISPSLTKGQINHLIQQEVAKRVKNFKSTQGGGRDGGGGGGGGGKDKGKGNKTKGITKKGKKNDKDQEE